MEPADTFGFSDITLEREALENMNWPLKAEGPPRANFTQNVFGVVENEGSATIGVSITKAPELSSVSVMYATSSGGANPATPGVDYTDVSGSVMWNVGSESDRSFSVPISDDLTFDGIKTVDLTLSNPKGELLLGGMNSATLNIIDPELVPIETEWVVFGFALGLLTLAGSYLLREKRKAGTH